MLGTYDGFKGACYGSATAFSFLPHEHGNTRWLQASWIYEGSGRRYHLIFRVGSFL